MIALEAKTNMSTEPSVRYIIANELQTDKTPPIATDDEFDEESDDKNDFDEIDGELTPLTHGVDSGLLVPRNGDPNKVNRRIIPAGFFPQWPSSYPEAQPDVGNTSLNLYQQKKSMAQGMLDLALLSANANQLRYVLDSNVRNHYYYVSLSLISCSLVMQVLVAIALVFKSRYNIDDAQDYNSADRINNFILIGILLITITNVVSSAFAPAPMN